MKLITRLASLTAVVLCMTAAASADQTFYDTTTGSYESGTYPDRFFVIPTGVSAVDVQMWGGGGGGNWEGPNGGGFGGAGGWVNLTIPIGTLLPNGQVIAPGEVLGYEVGSGGGDATILPSGGIGNGGNGNGGGGGGGATFLWLGSNNSTLIGVAAGGGGGFTNGYYSNNGGAGGGLNGSANQDASDPFRATPGSQTGAGIGVFGGTVYGTTSGQYLLGGSANGLGGAGGGAGYFGGGAGVDLGGAGGSSYIDSSYIALGETLGLGVSSAPFIDPVYSGYGELYGANDLAWGTNNTGGGGLIAFTAISIPSVPDAVSTLPLLGGTLAGLAALRRRFFK
jgi:hypothetical protein